MEQCHLFGVEGNFLQKPRAFVCRSTVIHKFFYSFFTFPLAHTKSMCKKSNFTQIVKIFKIRLCRFNHFLK